MAREAALRADRTGLARLLAQRLIVCVGTGGVGKTTTAAALALAAARHGRPTAVITVDPSRRLKDALGLDALASEPRPVPLGGRRRAARRDGARHQAHLRSPDRRASPRVRRWPSASSPIASTRRSPASSAARASTWRWRSCTSCSASTATTLIVVDTPPSADVRDLLTAPLRMTELLASQAVQFLKAPSSILGGSSESGLARATLTAVLRALERWTGMGLLGDLSDFAAGFEQLADGFRARAAAIGAALRAPDDELRDRHHARAQHRRRQHRLRRRAPRRRLSGRRHHRQPRVSLPTRRHVRRRVGKSPRCARSCTPTTPTSPPCRAATTPRCAPLTAAHRCTAAGDRAGAGRAAGFTARAGRFGGRDRRVISRAGGGRGRQKAKIKRQKSKVPAPPFDFCLLPFAFLYFFVAAARADFFLRAARFATGAAAGCGRSADCAATSRSTFMLRLTMLPCRFSILVSTR